MTPLKDAKLSLILVQNKILKLANVFISIARIPGDLPVCPTVSPFTHYASFILGIARRALIIRPVSRCFPFECKVVPTTRPTPSLRWGQQKTTQMAGAVSYGDDAIKWNKIEVSW